MSISVSLKNLTLSYQRHPAVHHLNGKFSAGSLTAITGPNGAGKSTLLKAIAGMLPPQEGEIIISPPGKALAYLPQLTGIRADFPITVLQMVCTGLWTHCGSAGNICAADRTNARATLKTVGLDGFASRQLGSLSTGQLQRALFARLMMQDAQLILLDEPFNGVDEHTTAKLLEIIMQWHAQGRTIICVTHDTQIIRKHFTHCLLLARDCIGWGKPEAVLLAENMAKASNFREAWQTNSEVCHL